MRKKLITILSILIILIIIPSLDVFSSNVNNIDINITFSYEKSTFTYVKDEGTISGHTPGEVNVVVPEQDANGNIITEIANGVFYNDDYIKTLEIPATVTTLGWLNLLGCNNLEIIILHAEDPITTWTSLFGLQLNNNVKIYVPDTVYNIYRNASGWRNYKNQIYRMSSM